MDRALFEAVRQKSLAQWSHRTVVRNKSDHLLTGLLFDDAGHRMVPTHATKAGIRYRYYASAPVLHGEAKTASAGSVSRVPAADVEDVIVERLKEHLATKQDGATSSASLDHEAIAQSVVRIVVQRDRLVIQLKSDDAHEASEFHRRPAAFNSMAEATFQKTSPDPGPAQRIAKRRSAGAVRASRAVGQRHRPRSSVAG